MLLNWIIFNKNRKKVRHHHETNITIMFVLKCHHISPKMSIIFNINKFEVRLIIFYAYIDKSCTLSNALINHFCL